MLLAEVKWKWVLLVLSPAGIEFFLNEEPTAPCQQLGQLSSANVKLTHGLLLKHCQLPPEQLRSGRSKSENLTVSIEIRVLSYQITS